MSALFFRDFDAKWYGRMRFRLRRGAAASHGLRYILRYLRGI